MDLLTRQDLSRLTCSVCGAGGTEVRPGDGDKHCSRAHSPAAEPRCRQGSSLTTPGVVFNLTITSLKMRALGDSRSQQRLGRATSPTFLPGAEAQREGPRPGASSLHWELGSASPSGSPGVSNPSLAAQRNQEMRLGLGPHAGVKGLKESKIPTLLTR